MTAKKLKLRPSVKAKWLAALRSGDYEQTGGELRSLDGKSFCCLGVLCNIHAQEHPRFAKTQKSIKLYDGRAGVPPARVLKWAFGATYNSVMDGGVELKSPGATPEDEDTTTLAEMNDGGESFKSIAKHIEKEL